MEVTLVLCVCWRCFTVFITGFVCVLEMFYSFYNWFCVCVEDVLQFL